MAYTLQQTSDGQYKCPYCDTTWPTPVTNRVIRERPLNADAKQNANKAVEDCPHLKDAGSPGTRRVTMERHDYPCRRKWVDAYLSEKEEDPPPDTEPECTVAPCPDKGDLYITVVVKSGDSSHKPVPDAKVSVTGPETRNGKTDQYGKANFYQVKVGNYTVKASKKEKKGKVAYRYKGQASQLVTANRRTYLRLVVSHERHVPLQWIVWQKWSSVSGPGVIKIRGTKSEKRIVLERMDWVPADYLVTKTKRHHLADDTSVFGSWRADVTRIHATYGPGSQSGAFSPPKPGRTDRAFGGYTVVHPSWDDCKSADDLLKKFGPGK